MQIPSTWIRTIKPRGYFERRKSPAGDNGEIHLNTDYHHTLHHSTYGVETEHRELPTSHPTAWPIKLLVVVVLVGLIGSLVWLYLIG